ncbi:hypothetical protein amrb99_96660 [Actinomadura sp. RB99]|nr:hypothetical protein [Actinomadura sp. RB99]
MLQIAPGPGAAGSQTSDLRNLRRNHFDAAVRMRVVSEDLDNWYVFRELAL